MHMLVGDAQISNVYTAMLPLLVASLGIFVTDSYYRHC